MIIPIISRVTEREYTHGVITASARSEDEKVDLQVYIQGQSGEKKVDLLGPHAISLSDLDQLVCVLMAIRKDFWLSAQPICVGEHQ